MAEEWSLRYLVVDEVMNIIMNTAEREFQGGQDSLFRFMLGHMESGDYNALRKQIEDLFENIHGHNINKAHHLPRRCPLPNQKPNAPTHPTVEMVNFNPLLTPPHKLLAEAPPSLTQRGTDTQCMETPKRNVRKRLEWRGKWTQGQSGPTMDS